MVNMSSYGREGLGGSCGHEESPDSREPFHLSPACLHCSKSLTLGLTGPFGKQEQEVGDLIGVRDSSQMGASVV